MFHEQCRTVQNALVKKEARRMNPKCQKKKKKPDADAWIQNANQMIPINK